MVNKMKNIKKIGFIGTGLMGASMACNILKGGLPVAVFNRTKEKTLPVLDKGAVLKDSVAELTRWADIIITMVGYPKDVEEVYFGGNGILNNAKEGKYLIDMATSKPSLALRIFEAAKAKGLDAIDAPVSGGDIGAKNATLAIMAGGDEKAFYELLPVFQLMGSNVTYIGGAGFGQHTKMCNQIAIAANIMGTCESLIYAVKAGLDPQKVLECISKGAAGSWQLSGMGPKMISGDNAPGFYIKHFQKDLAIALEEAEAMELSTPALKLAKSLYDILLREGKGELGTQALFGLYLKRING